MWFQGATSGPAASKPLKEPKPPFPRRSRSAGTGSRLTPTPRWKGERYRPAGKLEGQAASGTAGGDSGIGKAIAYFFARKEADVAITCLPEDVGRRRAADRGGGTRAKFVVWVGESAKTRSANRP